MGDILAAGASKTKFVNPMLAIPAVKTTSRKLTTKSSGKSRMKTGIASLFGDTNCSIAEVFKELDKDHNGSLDRDEITAALHSMDIPDSDVDDICRAMDTDGDGLISITEFEEYMDDAFDAADILECPEEIVKQVDELEVDMAQSIHSITDTYMHTAEIVEMESKLAETICAAGIHTLSIPKTLDPGCSGGPLRTEIAGSVTALAQAGHNTAPNDISEPSAHTAELRSVLETGAQNLTSNLSTEDRLQLLKQTGVELWKASKHDGIDIVHHVVKDMLKRTVGAAFSQDQLQRLSQCQLSAQQQSALRTCGLDNFDQFSNEHVAVLQKVGLTTEQETVLRELGRTVGRHFLQKFLPGHAANDTTMMAVLGGPSSRGAGSAAGMDVLKTMLTQQLVDRVTQADIPPITGSLDAAGGTFVLRNVRIEHFNIPAESLEFRLDATRDGATLLISDLHVRTAPFSWLVDKRKFPKLKDQGTAFINLDGLGLNVTMGIKTGRDGTPQIHNMRVALHLNDFAITVLQGRHRTLYNKVFRLVRFVVRKVRHIISSFTND